MPVFLVPLLARLLSVLSPLRQVLGERFGSIAAPMIYIAAGFGIVAALAFGAHEASRRGAELRDRVWEHKIADQNEHWHEIVRRSQLASMQAATREREHHVETLQGQSKRASDLERTIGEQNTRLATLERAALAKKRKRFGGWEPVVIKAPASCYSRAVSRVLNQ